MIFVIVPLGKEAPQVINWLWRVFMYTAGATVGASLLALLLGGVGQGLHALLPWFAYTWAVAILGLFALIFALKELNILRIRTPQVGWQVPASWMRPSRVRGNTLYGSVLTGQTQGQMHWYPFTFSGTSGDKVLLRLYSVNFAPAFYLWRPDGTSLC